MGVRNLTTEAVITIFDKTCPLSIQTTTQSCLIITWIPVKSSLPLLAVMSTCSVCSSTLQPFTVWLCGEKPHCCQSRCCHFADRFYLTARRLRASPQRESLIKFPFILVCPRSSLGITLHYNTLTYAHILLSNCSLYSSSALFAAPSHLPIPIPPLLQSIISAVVTLNIKKQDCGRIPPVQVSVMCCDERTQRQRDLLIMKHGGAQAAALRGKMWRKRNEWLENQLNITGERGEEFRGQTDGWNLNFKKGKKKVWEI